MKQKDISNVLETKTYHVFYKNKHLKQLSTPIVSKIEKLIKEFVNPPKTDKKVFIIRIKYDPDSENRRVIISCTQQTITPNLYLVSKTNTNSLDGDVHMSVSYSVDELKKYGFELSHVKKIMLGLKKKTIDLEKNIISISEILS